MQVLMLRLLGNDAFAKTRMAPASNHVQTSLCGIEAFRQNFQARKPLCSAFQVSCVRSEQHLCHPQMLLWCHHLLWEFGYTRKTMGSVRQHDRIIASSRKQNEETQTLFIPLFWRSTISNRLQYVNDGEQVNQQTPAHPMQTPTS